MESRAEKITTTDAANILKVSDARIRQMIAKKQLRAEKFGRDLMVFRSEVVLLKGRKTGRPRKDAVERLSIKSRRRFQRTPLKSLAELRAEQGTKPFSLEALNRVRAALGPDAFNGFDEWLEATRKQDIEIEKQRGDWWTL